jgi:hypothetical protein
MKRFRTATALILVAALGSLTPSAWAQDETAPAETADQASTAEAAPLLSAEELQVLVARIAYYPDEVIAVTLPAATYPLDIVQASRFLEQHKSKPDAQPNPAWDTSVLSLLNYPVVINMMNDDLDWTTQLGEAMLAQQGDVMDAIQQVRKSAYVEGHLTSNDKTNVVYENDVVEIKPSNPEVVYVPVYQPATLPAEQPASTTVIENNTTVMAPAYDSSTAVYSEPYPPYYSPGATFLTGAIVGGLTAGFLMNWGDDDIDVDFNGGNYDNWHPGGDTNINGDVNIGNKVNSGNRESWKQNRDQRQAERTGAQPKGSRAAQPAANKRPKASQQPAANKAAANTTPAKAAKKAQPAAKPRAAETRKTPQKPTSFGDLGSGQQAVKAKDRGAQSRSQQGQKTPFTAPSTLQNKARAGGGLGGGNAPRANVTPKKSSNQSFGGVSNGRATQKASQRGGASQSRRKR